MTSDFPKFEMSLRSSEAAKGVIDYMILIKQILFTVKFLFEMSLRSSEAAKGTTSQRHVKQEFYCK
jgi:hypothetical protein